VHTADLYDSVYQFKNYQAEAEKIRQILCKEGKEKCSLLELACGTGEYLRYFQDYKCTGIDLCQRSLELAQMKCSTAIFDNQDMCEFNCSKRQDVVIALFGSIGYVPKDRLYDFFLRCNKSLKPDGLLIVEPWIQQVDFEGGYFLLNGIHDGYPFSRVAHVKEEKGVSILQFHYLFYDRDKVVLSHSQDRLTMHSIGFILTCLEEAGFVISRKAGGFLEKSSIYILKKYKNY